MSYENYNTTCHATDGMSSTNYSHVGKIRPRIVSVTDGVETASNQNFRPRFQTKTVLKRTLDLCIAISALIFLMPFMAFAAIMVRLADGGPALFSQERIGRDGKTFQCYKFRSMIINSQEVLDQLLATDPVAASEWAADQKLRNDPRITKIGAFLRKTSLDELPQLMNVIRGEMSIVGPRPIIQAEIPRYGQHTLDGQDILVVGGAGYIGSHVCKMIHSLGGRPITIDNLSCGHEHAVKWGPSANVIRPIFIPTMLLAL